jgi:hypothetical protein
MRIGIPADIHESLTNLRWTIDALHDQGADRLVVLGDVFELGHLLGGFESSMTGLITRSDLLF